MQKNMKCPKKYIYIISNRLVFNRNDDYSICSYLFLDDVFLSKMINDTIFRFLGSIVFILIIYVFGHKVLKLTRPFLKSFLIIIPALLISINNFPFIPLLTGNAEITNPLYTIIVFAITCISVGLFEELVFRGLILFFLLQNYLKIKKDFYFL